MESMFDQIFGWGQVASVFSSCDQYLEAIPASSAQRIPLHSTAPLLLHFYTMRPLLATLDHHHPSTPLSLVTYVRKESLLTPLGHVSALRAKGTLSPTTKEQLHNSNAMFVSRIIVIMESASWVSLANRCANVNSGRN